MSAGVMGRWGTDDATASSPSAVAGATPNVVVNVRPTAAPPTMSKWKVAMWIGAIAAGWYWGLPMIRSYFRYGTVFPPPPAPHVPLAHPGATPPASPPPTHGP